MAEQEYQHFAGYTSPCCAGMLMLVHIGVVKKGFLWGKYAPPRWYPWTFNISGKGYKEVSPIRYCPYCGIDLDAGED